MPFKIVWGGAIEQHHGVEAAYLGPFDDVGKSLGSLQRDPAFAFFAEDALSS